jgi:RNase H-like domain found in reverse transcriptase
MRSIEEALSEIPTKRSLKEIYQLTLNSMVSSCDQEDLDVAKKIFMWTLCAPRPLSLDELTAALKASMETRMMDVECAVKETCGSPIEVVNVNSQKYVMAVHITLREFMLLEDATGCFAFSKAKAHAQIARTCLYYLLRPQFSKPFMVEMDVKIDAAEVATKYPLPMELRISIINRYAISKATKPLSHMNIQQIEWTQPMQVAFDKLKKALTSAPCPAVPDLDGKFEVTTDASEDAKAVGAVLTQNGHPVAYIQVEEVELASDQLSSTRQGDVRLRNLNYRWDCVTGRQGPGTGNR